MTPARQLSLVFEPGLAARYQSLRDVVAHGVYERGLSAVAGKVDMAPSKLSEKLAGGNDRPRDLGIEEFERYLEKTRDLRPIYYLIERFLEDPGVQQAEAMAQLSELVKLLPALMSAAGVTPANSPRKR
jgi:hypothetical protein